MSVLHRLVCLCFTLSASCLAGTPLLDSLIPGEALAPDRHLLQLVKAERMTGALGLPAVRLLPGGAEPWEGGNLEFRMAVDPEKPNYFTARFHGDEVNANLLILFCEGKQVGYRHLGDIDILALADDEPRYNGRFYYVTTPLPRALTAGKKDVALSIRSTGPVWGYGRDFAQYQKPMTQPSRAIYRLATHTEPCYIPEAEEKQGTPPPDKLRTGPGPEVMIELQKRINNSVGRMLRSKKPLNQMESHLLAQAYHVKWTAAWQKPEAMEQVIRSADARHAAWLANPDAVWNDPVTWNPGWFGLGPMADAVRLLSGGIAPRLDEAMPDGNPRRAAWVAMFQASRDWLRVRRRFYTNQSLFIDTNLYRSNAALALMDPAQAWPEQQAMRYLHEAAGVIPWMGSDTPDGGREQPLGPSYLQLTKKGLSRELGYVGGYGEILGGLVEACNATRMPGGKADPALLEQLSRLQRARVHFRYPMQDEEGFRAMRLETGVGWRDSHFPGQVMYAQRSRLDESPLQAAMLTREPAAVAACRQMLADNQFFSSVEHIVKDRNFRAEFGMLGIPDEYEAFQSLPGSDAGMPMSPGRPDSVFADEENGVVAIRHGEEILYASLYWRARQGINGLARIHWIRPDWQQVAVVAEDVKFEPSGKSWKRPDWTNFGFANGGPRFPGKLESAHKGELLPIAAYPEGAPFDGKKESPYAGRAEYYQLRFGPYLIAMNTTAGKTFTLEPPADVKTAVDVATGKPVALENPVPLPPLTTRVLYTGSHR